MPQWSTNVERQQWKLACKGAGASIGISARL